MTEPTLSDVIQRLQVLDLQMQAGFAESRARDAEMKSSLQQFWDAFVDFRREYMEHSHPDAA